MSVVFATQLGVTGRLVIKGAVAFYDLLTVGKSMPGTPTMLNAGKCSQ
jgi:ribonucleotide reductase alpha subunit